MKQVVLLEQFGLYLLVDCRLRLFDLLFEVVLESLGFFLELRLVTVALLVYECLDRAKDFLFKALCVFWWPG